MKRIEFVFFDAGGGHRAAATALEMSIQSQQRPWEIRLTNLQELLDGIDPLRRIFRIRIQDFYNGMLRNGWTLGSTQLMRALQFAIRLFHRPTVRMLETHWREWQPDMVVSFVPHFNRAMWESYQSEFPGRPFVTILTDIADYPPHFWIERQPQFFVCGSERAVQQARAMGHPDERIFRASGMILHPRFYAAQPSDRAVERRRLGLLPDLPTALVLFGGHGSKEILNIVERLDAAPLELQLILLCGKNQKLLKTLRERKSRLRYYVEGFTQEVPYYMHLSDFFIGKPGPGSVSEALAKHLPVIVECNSWTLPQERYNAQWVKERNVGLVLGNFKEIVLAVTELLRPDKFTQFRENAAREINRAVFEIPDFLEQILHRANAAHSEELKNPSSVAAIS